VLILTRKIGEAIAIGDNIKIKLLEIKGGQAKIGIEAPSLVTVHREEVFQRIVEENKKAAQDIATDLHNTAEFIAPKGTKERN